VKSLSGIPIRMNAPDKPHRPIRSFVRREGRITEAQRRALDDLLPRYSVPAGTAPLDFRQLFGRAAPVHVEIGFGNGAALAAMAAAHPENNYLGIEVHRPGVGSLLRQVEASGLANVRVACHDAVEVLARIPDESLAALYIFFPDPWHKKRHHKRRLMQPEFVEALRRRLQPGGLLHFATDWEDYAQHTQAVLAANPGFENTAAGGGYAPRPAERPLTRFEQRGARLGHTVRDFCFRRRS
jgi:tRNA (guanine-N7-)-methyltransferase